MVQKVALSFNLPEAESEKCFRDHLKLVDQFMSDMTVPPKLFVFYQPRQAKTPELFITAGSDMDKLEGKCVYFIRDSVKPISNKVAQDSTVICGETSGNLLQVYEDVLSQIYAPIITNLDEWGKISDENQKKTFITDVMKFDENIKSKLENLRGDVELKTPEAPHDKIEQKPVSYSKASLDSECLKHFVGIVTSWCDTITKYLKDDPSSIPLKPDNMTGPKVEIEHWSRRLLTLISITEQLKSKPNRVVTGVLKARALRQEQDESKGVDDSAPGSQGSDDIRKLLERWREVDLAITDALNEARDNYRFLDNLRKITEPLYEETPTVVADSMPTLMNSMKMIHTLSRHYGTEVRMTNLFERITNQMITRCKEDLYMDQPPANLWKQDSHDVIIRMRAAIKLHKEYPTSTSTPRPAWPPWPMASSSTLTSLSSLATSRASATAWRS